MPQRLRTPALLREQRVQNLGAQLTQNLSRDARRQAVLESGGSGQPWEHKDEGLG